MRLCVGRRATDWPGFHESEGGGGRFCTAFLGGGHGGGCRGGLGSWVVVVRVVLDRTGDRFRLDRRGSQYRLRVLDRRGVADLPSGRGQGEGCRGGGCPSCFDRSADHWSAGAW